jgi:flagellar protein FliS
MQTSFARAVATYQNVQVTSRSPLELVVMLYDGALSSLEQARTAMAQGDLVAKGEALSRALAIVAHLQGTLNMDQGGEVASRLDGLYDFVVERITTANIRRDIRPLEESITALASVRDAWAEIASPAQQIAV